MTEKANKKQKRAKPIKGITADAVTLGVTREHLWRVLTGKRKSPGLLKRYEDLQTMKMKN